MLVLQTCQPIALAKLVSDVRDEGRQAMQYQRLLKCITSDDVSVFVHIWIDFCQCAKKEILGRWNKRGTVTLSPRNYLWILVRWRCLQSLP